MSEDTKQREEQTSKQPTGETTPELVKKVTDRVYAMLLEDLRIERERYRAPVENRRYQ